MPNLESLRRFGLVLELAEAAGDGDWAGWAKGLGGLDNDTRADVVRQSSPGHRHAVRPGGRAAGEHPRPVPRTVSGRGHGSAGLTEAVREGESNPTPEGARS